MIPALHALFVFTATVNLLVAGMVYAVFRGERDKSAQLWIVGSLLVPTGIFLLMVRSHLPGFISFGVINFMMLYAMVLFRDSYLYLLNKPFQPSRGPLLFCLAYGLFQYGLSATGNHKYLSFVASIAWCLVHVWILISLNPLRKAIRNRYFDLFMVFTMLGLCAWLVRVVVVSVFNISMASDVVMANVYSLVAAHIVLVAQQIVYLVVRLTDEKGKKQQIARLSQSLEAAWADKQAMTELQQRERERLLQDMHDGFGSQLASAKLLVHSGKLSQAEVESLLDDCMADLQLVVDNLMPSSDGFQEALSDFEHRLNKRFKHLSLALHFDIDLPEDVKIDPSRSLQCLRVLQEAIANAVKHSGARQIWVRVHTKGPELELTVRDDGHGLPALLKRGRGLNSMETRAREMGAKLSLSEGEGLQVTLKLGLHPAL